MTHSARRARATGRGVVTALVVAVLALAPALLTAGPASAATAAVTLTPATATVESNVPVTFSLSITCNGPGVCDNTQVTFPANAVTGNGSRTDLSTWIGNSSCPGVTRGVGPGVVTFSYGSLATGTSVCTFPVRAPEYTTLNGAQATLTPTISGSSFVSSTGAPATLTLTAGHNVSVGASATARVLPGAEVTFTVALNCGANGEYTGDIGLSSLSLQAALPANLVFAGFTPRNTLPGTFTAPAVGSSGGTLTYNDPTGASCANPPLTVTNAIVVTIRGTITGGAGTQACLNATSSFVYLDRTTTDTASAGTAACATVVDIQTQVNKGAGTRSLGNVGQYLFGGNAYPYTFPGDWDQSAASVYYDIRVSTVPTSIASGLAYLINDPLPCLDNLAANVYSSNPTGVTCVNPAFVPTRVTVTGFAPTAGNAIRLHRADGTTTDVAYAAGGWTIPTTGSPVSELEFPAFANEGSNSAGTITFRVVGHAASSAQPGRLMRNTVTSQPYLAGTTDALGTAQTFTANVLIADRGATAGDTGRPIIQPALVGSMTGTCTASLGLRHPTLSQRATYLELTTAPSAAIYLDYLAPAGATVTSSTTVSFQLAGVTNGRTYPTGAIAATVIADYDGTGRTLYRWAIPAGVAAVPGVYLLGGLSVTLNLGAGCAGTYQNDMTLGYGAPLTRCAATTAVLPPLQPTGNTDLRSNGTPLSGNYCGASAPLSVAAINPGFTVGMTVQGSLDGVPAAAGTNGTVGASGGEATYSVTFANSGQSNLDDPVLYNLMPRVGDTEVTSAAARDSQFAVTLLSMGALPAGVTVEYSTAANPCRPEVLAINPGCVDDWSSIPPGALSDTSALRFSYSGTLGVVGSGGATSFAVAFDVSTPAIAVGRVARNSVGATALAGGSLLGAAESTHVGLEADGQPTIVKAAAAPTYDAVGDAVAFTFTVTNESGVPLTDVTVTDELVDAAAGSVAPTVTCSALSAPAAACSGASTSLLPGQTALFVASYTVAQDDLDYGRLVDRATVTAAPARGAALSNTSDEVTVLADQNPAISLLKAVTPTTVDAAGDVVGYTFTVTNSGNVTVGSVGVSELAFGGSGTIPSATCPDGDLAPGDDVICTAGYTVTQDDMDSGSVANTAVATAEFDGAGILSASSTATVAVTQLPSLDLLKSALPATVGSAGQAVTYSFRVTNDGNVTIDGIDVQEVSFSGTGTLDPVACPAAVLAPAAGMTCTAAYVVTQDDIDAGAIDNTATVTGNDPSGAALPLPPTSSLSLAVVFAPALTLVKTADATRVNRPGEVIGYEFLVINNGNTTLTGLGVDETAFTGAGTLSAVACPVTVLAPTASTTCTAEYTVVAADASTARISNTAEAVASSASAGGPVRVASASSTVLVVVDPGVSGVLTASGSDSAVWLSRLAAAALAAGLTLLVVAHRRLARRLA